MKLILGRPAYVLVLMFCLTLMALASCTPGADPISVTRAIATEEVPIADSGWCVGGPELLTPKDMDCYIGSADSGSMRWINGEAVFIFAEPGSVNDWAGAAVIFHRPTMSLLALDEFGDVDPQASTFTSRAGLTAFDELMADTVFMVGLRGQIQERYQTSSSGQPEIRLDVAWQDGETTIFLVAVAGLEADDDRFYCPSQAWTIGEETIVTEASCVPKDPAVPVRNYFFAPYTIKGREEQSVQVELDGVMSNVIQVSEGEVAEETAVYLAALEQVTNRTLLVRGETATGLENVEAQIADIVDSELVENFQAGNEKSLSLQYLFQNSNAYSVQPSESIDLNFLTPGDFQEACKKFREEYSDLGGIITLSGIGYNEEGSEALVYILKECGTAVRSAAFYMLAKTADGWQVTNTVETAADLPVLRPDFKYNNSASGCGDIFVYKSNSTMSEFITASVDVNAIALSSEPTTLALADYPEAIGARIAVYSDNVGRLGEFPYCNDVGPEAEPHSVWQAVSGSITISVSAEPPGESCVGEPYQTTILLEDVTFALEDETVNLPSLLFEDVQVGWCPG